MTLIGSIKAQYKVKNGVYYLTEQVNTFEEIYLKVREAEGRIYSDNELRYLPDIDTKHKFYKEWLIRKGSIQMLASYLDSKPKNKTLLELGCGNGWLTNKLAELEFKEVIGMDVNVSELEQAARVFLYRPNLLFAYGDILKTRFEFDYIVVSSVIAYFEDLKSLIDSLLTKLNYNGEIHIVESPFYEDTLSARERSIKYYNELGFPQMIENYHHHSLRDLKRYNYSILYDPNTSFNKIKRKFNSTLSPFYWVKISK